MSPRLLAVALLSLVALPASAQSLDVYSNPAAGQQLPLDAATRQTSADALQATLYELTKLQHDTHQAHWNVVGQNFYSLHDMLGEIYQGLFAYIDMTAERKLALGVAADADLGRSAEGSDLAPYPEGYRQDYQVPKELSDRFYAVVQRVEGRIQEVSDDPSTQDVLIDVARRLELDLWKLRALQLGAPAGR